VLLPEVQYQLQGCRYF